MPGNPQIEEALKEVRIWAWDIAKAMTLDAKMIKYPVSKLGGVAFLTAIHFQEAFAV